MKLYATLVGPLFGNYIEIECRDELHARCQLKCSKLKDLWCSIYTEEEIEKQVEAYNLTKAKTPQQGIFDQLHEVESLYHRLRKKVEKNDIPKESIHAC